MTAPLLREQPAVLVSLGMGCHVISRHNGLDLCLYVRATCVVAGCACYSWVVVAFLHIHTWDRAF